MNPPGRLPNQPPRLRQGVYAPVPNGARASAGTTPSTTARLALRSSREPRRVASTDTNTKPLGGAEPVLRDGYADGARRRPRADAGAGRAGRRRGPRPRALADDEPAGLGPRPHRRLRGPVAVRTAPAAWSCCAPSCRRLRRLRDAARRARRHPATCGRDDALRVHASRCASARSTCSPADLAAEPALNADGVVCELVIQPRAPAQRDDAARRSRSPSRASSTRASAGAAPRSAARDRAASSTIARRRPFEIGAAGRRLRLRQRAAAPPRRAGAPSRSTARR